MKARTLLMRAAVATTAAATITAITMAPASAQTWSGVKRCAGGPTHYVGVHFKFGAVATEVTAHNLLKDGPGWTYQFTNNGYGIVWTPFNAASWKVLAVGPASGVYAVCS